MIAPEDGLTRALLPSMQRSSFAIQLSVRPSDVEGPECSGTDRFTAACGGQGDPANGRGEKRCWKDMDVSRAAGANGSFVRRSPVADEPRRRVLDAHRPACERRLWIADRRTVHFEQPFGP